MQFISPAGRSAGFTGLDDDDVFNPRGLTPPALNGPAAMTTGSSYTGSLWQ